MLNAASPNACAQISKREGTRSTSGPSTEFDAGGVSLAGDLKPPSASGRVLAAGADPRRVNYAWGK